MDKRVIASAISTDELAKGLHDLVALRWDEWDLSPLLAYLVDTCDADMLPYLAVQFDIDGLKGFELANTELQKRNIVKRSIALHKYIGTPWALREACDAIGFPIVVIDEHVGATWGGVPVPDPNDWARFRILIGVDERPIDAETSRKLRMFIEVYKNERSHLVDVGYFLPFEDEHVFRVLDGGTGVTQFYDGVPDHSGGILYGAGEREELFLTFVMVGYQVLVDGENKFVTDSAGITVTDIVRYYNK